MITLLVSLNGDGVTLGLHPKEWERWPKRARRVFIAKEIGEVRLSDILNEAQARAAAAILTGSKEFDERLVFVDSVTDEQLMTVEP